jgi:Zn-dependent protease with chaperone function
MTPNQRKFAEIVRSAENFAKRSPGGYKFTVATLASLGYIYIGVVILLTLGLMAALIGAVILLVKYFLTAPLVSIRLMIVIVPLILTLGAFALSLFTSLWVVIPSPTGPQVTRDTMGRLYAFIDDVSDSLKAPRFHYVLLSDELNAGVVRTRRFGLIGPNRNYLILGIPLMRALGREQFRAIIAHELGHISRNHNSFAGWIYGQRESWGRILRYVGHNRVFTPFLIWYSKYFAAYTFVLARSNEYVADRCAAELVGKKTAAEALAALHIWNYYLDEKLWPTIWREAGRSPKQQIAPYTTMFCPDNPCFPTSAERAHWLTKAWLEKTELDDTHPSLSSRLSALGFNGSTGGPLDPPSPPFQPPAIPDVSAADELLGIYSDRIANKMDEEWRQVAPALLQRNYRQGQASSQQR